MVFTVLESGTSTCAKNPGFPMGFHCSGNVQKQFKTTIKLMGFATFRMWAPPLCRKPLFTDVFTVLEKHENVHLRTTMKTNEFTTFWHSPKPVENISFRLFSQLQNIFRQRLWEMFQTWHWIFQESHGKLFKPPAAVVKFKPFSIKSHRKCFK